MIRVLIVEAEPRVRRCLRQRLELETDLDVLDEVADGPAALAAIARSPADVVLMDIGLPGGDGLAVVEAVGRCHPTPRIVIHGLDDSPCARARAAALGAVFVAKGEAEEPLLSAIRALAPGPRPDPGTRLLPPRTSTPGIDEAPEATPVA